jgi:hypothetical protein
MDRIEFYEGPPLPTTSRNYKKVREHQEMLVPCDRLPNDQAEDTALSKTGKHSHLALSRPHEDSENRGLSDDYSITALNQRSPPGMYSRG